jgi:choline dehydrogenase-like flavoprotein
MHAIDDRKVKLSRGRLLGGSSGVNGTLCIRGPKQDYDDWGIEGWSGEEVYKYMKKVRLAKLSGRRVAQTRSCRPRHFTRDKELLRTKISMAQMGLCTQRLMT